MWWLRELLSYFRFLAVTSDNPFWESKRVYEFVAPAIIAAAIFIVWLFVPGLFGPSFLGRFVGLLFQFMVFVVPFHLAALAAFATFERTGIDERLPGTDAELLVWSNEDNARVVKSLTLRQYASLLFGYLCTIGIIFIVTYLFASNIEFRFVFVDAFYIVYAVCTLGMLFFVAHYAVLTAYAITFLFDKVNKIGK